VNLKALMLEPEFLSTLEADVHLVAISSRCVLRLRARPWKRLVK
jgi:hypothetical protein